MAESNVFNDFYLIGGRANFLTASVTHQRIAVPERAQLISIIVGIFDADAGTDATHDIDPLRQGSSTGMPTLEVTAGIDEGEWEELYDVTPVTFLENEHISSTVTGGDVSNINYCIIYRFRRN